LLGAPIRFENQQLHGFYANLSPNNVDSGRPDFLNFLAGSCIEYNDRA
jgi:hypothetical protein